MLESSFSVYTLGEVGYTEDVTEAMIENRRLNRIASIRESVPKQLRHHVVSIRPNRYEYSIECPDTRKLIWLKPLKNMTNTMLVYPNINFNNIINRP